jgi:acetyl-CoA C-acetyltransferase/acetyl-CoA acyltransferase
MSERLVIVDGLRTPFCKAGSDLSSLGADELGRIAVNALLTRTGLDPQLVDEVIFGCVGQPAEAANIARVISLRAGIPESVPAMTVHRNCASGFEAFTTAYERMAAGRGSIYIVGGAESMSRVPMLFRDTAAKKFASLSRAKSATRKFAALTSFRLADFEPRPGLKLGLTDPVCGLNMGETAELLARENGITREAQDAFAIESHHKAIEGAARLAEEITPVYLGGKAIARDNGPRTDQTMAVLGGLRPIFEKYGSVTAGNSSQITDGAVALLVMTEKRAAELGFQPLGALVGYAYAGCDPARMGLGPIFAIAQAEKRYGLKCADADLIEVNEAFAAQVLTVLQKLEGQIPPEKLNVNGGAIALGHPVGATGARLVLTSLKELARRNARRALVSLCVGGGQGGAIWLERI